MQWDGNEIKRTHLTFLLPPIKAIVVSATPVSIRLLRVSLSHKIFNRFFFSNVLLIIKKRMVDSNKLSEEKTEESEGITRSKKGLTLKIRMRKNATAPENPIWIMVRVIGYGKLKYFVERTHCRWVKNR
jgi:hypothetical protein